MKIRKVEVVTRYQVEFLPHETKVLRANEWWRERISVKQSQRNGRHPNDQWGRATLTKSEINRACDLLGVNGREFMARALGEVRP